MPPPPDVQQQAARNAAIVALAARELAALWPRVDWASDKAVDGVKTIYRAITTRYGSAAAAVAAELYDGVRAEHAPRSAFRAAPADPLPQQWLDRAVDSAFHGRTPGAAAPGTPISGQTTSDLPVEQRVTARLTTKLQKHVLQPGRDTIAQNTAKDPAKPRWIRVPTGDKTCAFCIMLASREIGVIPGPQKRSFGGYLTRDTALFDKNGDKYHTGCDCEAWPLFAGMNQLDVSPNLPDYQNLYYKATAAAGTHRDLKKILSEMRKVITTDGASSAQ